MNRCSFRLRVDSVSESLRHDVSLSGIESLPDDPYHCDRDAVSGREYCPIHTPITGESEESAEAYVLEAIERAADPEHPSENLSFVGARLDSLNLTELDLDPGDLADETLDFRFSLVTDEVRLPDADLGIELDFTGARLGKLSSGWRERNIKKLRLNHCRIGHPDATRSADDSLRTEGDVLVSRIDGEPLCLRSISCKDLQIRNTVIYGDVGVQKVESDGIKCSDTTITGDTTVQDLTTVELRGSNLTVKGDGVLDGITVSDEADLTRLDIDTLDVSVRDSDADLTLRGTTVHDEARFDFGELDGDIVLEGARFSEVEITGRRIGTIDLSAVEIGGDCRIVDTAAIDEILLDDATCGGMITVQNCTTVGDLGLAGATVSGVEIISGAAGGDTKTIDSIDLSGAEIGQDCTVSGLDDVDRISLERATCTGTVTVLDCSIDELLLPDATVSGIELACRAIHMLEMSSVTINGDCTIRDLDHARRVALNDASCAGTVDVENCSIGELLLTTATIGEDLEVVGDSEVQDFSAESLHLGGHLLVGTSEARVTGEQRTPADENDIVTLSRCTLSDATLGTVITSGSRIGGTVDWSGLTVGSIESPDTRFGDPVCDGSDTGEGDGPPELDFRDLRVTDVSSFAGAEFRSPARFSRSRFTEAIDFEGCRFEDTVWFDRLQFKDRGTFTRRVGDQESDVSGAGGPPPVFGGDAVFREAVFEAPPDLRWKSREDGATVYPHEQGSDGAGRTVDGTADFTGASVQGAELEGFSAEAIEFRGTDLTDANLHRAILRDATLNAAVLSRSNLTAATLSGADMYGAVFGEARIDEETRIDDSLRTDPVPVDEDVNYLLKRYRGGRRFFERIRSARNPSEGEDKEENWDDDAGRARNAYRKLERLADENGQTEAARNWFFRRREVLRYEQQLAVASATGRIEFVYELSKYLNLSLQRHVTRYGDGLRNVVTTLFAVIVGLGVLYPFGLMTAPGAGMVTRYPMCATALDALAGCGAALLNGLYFSALTITTLGFGPFEPVGFGAALAVIETGIGGLMFALLIFVFGRRATR